MNSPFTQIYTNYVTNVNKLVYDTNLAMVKATQDFTQEAWKMNPMKDMFNLDATVSKKTK